MFFRTSLEDRDGRRIWISAELNTRPQCRWFAKSASAADPRPSAAPAPDGAVVRAGAAPAESAPEPTEEVPPQPLLERYPSFFDLVFLHFSKVQERLIPLTGDSTLTKEKVRMALISQYREKGLDACSFTREGAASSPEEADTFLFLTGYRDTKGREIYLRCERNQNAKREPWFGRYFISEEWELRDSSSPFLNKVFIFSSHLEYALPALTGSTEDITATANTKLVRMARRFDELPAEDIIYLNGFYRTYSEAEANQMILPTGFQSPSGEEIMLRCKRNHHPAEQPWVSRRFYLPSQNRFFGRQPGKWLMSWAKFKSINPMDISEEISALAMKAMPENWSIPGGGRNAILENYFVYTFVRLWREQKVEYSDDGRYAAFNTGLVDRTYEYIYALFVHQSQENDCREWQFLGFCVASQDYYGKMLSNSFYPLPKPARYFDSEKPIYYSFNDELPAKAQIPHYDAEHILLERTDRLPSKFLMKYAPQVPGLAEKLEAIKSLHPDDAQRHRLWKEIKSCLRADSAVYRRMKDSLDKAVEIAVKRAAWNYRTVIPYYTPKDDTISLLLPISLSSDGIPDAAMVLEPRYRRSAAPGGGIIHYMGHTIITLAMAYGNSRLVCRPESDWLNMDAVCKSGDTDQPLEDSDSMDEE